MNSITLSYPIISGDSLRLRSPAFEVLTLAAPITLGQLPNPLIYNQTAYLQSGHNMRVSFSDAVNLRSSLSGAQKEKDSTANATLWRKADLLYKINQLVIRNPNLVYEELQQLKRLTSLRGLVRLPDNIGLVSYCSDNHVNNVHSVSYCSDDALALRWRRLISVLAAVTKNPAVLSSCSLTCSINSKSSSGSLTETCRDLLLRLPVAITESPFVKWCSVCTKNLLFQVFTWCSPLDILVVFTQDGLRHKNSNAPKCGNTIEASNHNVKESYAMDTPQHNQTRLKFTFLIASGTQRLVDIHPVRFITVLADCEGEARLLAGKSNLVFVSRQGVAA